jgi:hypothetical protein
VADSGGSSYIESEYSLAVNMMNTASVLVQPPICKFGDALALSSRAVATLSLHVETAQLAKCADKMALRRLERAVCAHNVALYALYAGNTQYAWDVMLEAHRAVLRAPPEMQRCAYATAIIKAHAALHKLQSAMAAPVLDESDREGSNGAQSKRQVVHKRQTKRLVRHSGRASVRFVARFSGNGGKGAVSDRQQTSSAPPSQWPDPDVSATKLPRIASASSSFSHSPPRPRPGPGPLQLIRQKLRDHGR